MEQVEYKCNKCVAANGACQVWISDISVNAFKFGICEKSNNKYYANKKDVEWFIEEAEKRHRENGGLVVCDHAEECVNEACTFLCR